MLSKQDIELFLTYKDDISRQGQLISKSQHGYVGIFNEGATCYLNTLLQSLYNDLLFRSIIYAYKEGENQILDQFKRFFIFLNNSTASAITSSDLIASFGWPRSQVHDQHDIHELFSVLIDALGKAHPSIQENIKIIFEGRSKGY